MMLDGFLVFMTGGLINLLSTVIRVSIGFSIDTVSISIDKILQIIP